MLSRKVMPSNESERESESDQAGQRASKLLFHVAQQLTSFIYMYLNFTFYIKIVIATIDPLKPLFFFLFHLFFFYLLSSKNWHPKNWLSFLTEYLLNYCFN